MGRLVRLSLVMPYYRNAGMLARHLAAFAYEWSDRLKVDAEVVIVDDGSPVGERAREVYDRRDQALEYPQISIFRALVDSPWHQHAARNLGARMARGGWLLMTDADHLAPPATLEKVLRFGADRAPFHHTFGRVDMPDAAASLEAASTWSPTRNGKGEKKPHVNSFAIARDMYWRIGGYDEDFCGVYGTDIEWRRRMGQHAPAQHHKRALLVRVDRSVIADASTRDVSRKEGRIGNEKRAVLERKRLEGRADKITTLNFEWTRDL